MGKCEYLIAAAISENCDDPITKGLEKRGIIINRDDIDWSGVTYADGKTNVIEALTMLEGKQAYEIYQPSITPFNGTNTAAAVGTNRTSFTKQVKIWLPDSGPDVAENIIDPLPNGSFVVII